LQSVSAFGADVLVLEEDEVEDDDGEVVLEEDEVEDEALLEVDEVEDEVGEVGEVEDEGGEVGKVEDEGGEAATTSAGATVTTITPVTKSTVRITLASPRGRIVRRNPSTISISPPVAPMTG
jgi:hypothetical protein